MKKIKNNFICFGAVHKDYVFELKNDLIKYRTNPIKHKESYGGVAHNVAKTISNHEKVSLFEAHTRPLQTHSTALHQTYFEKNKTMLCN